MAVTLLLALGDFLKWVFCQGKLREAAAHVSVNVARCEVFPLLFSLPGLQPSHVLSVVAPFRWPLDALPSLKGNIIAAQRIACVES